MIRSAVGRRGASALIVAAGLAGASAATAAPPAATRDAAQAAGAIQATAGIVTSATFDQIPPAGNPVAIGTAPVGGFPRHGRTYTVLGTGDATVLQNANLSDATSTDNRDAPHRGARDVVTLRIALRAPSTARCLSVRFKFLSEEFPEYLGSPFNDAFIAELDNNSWTTDGARIVAPDNFAFDEVGRPISVNGAGESAVSRGEAFGTTYDAATAVLVASTPITPGDHTLYLSIFDQGDGILDSAVMLDQLTIDSRTTCVRGIARDTTPGVTAGAITIAGNRVSLPVSQLFPPRRLQFERLAYTRLVRGVTRLTATVSDNYGFRVRGARLTVRSIPPGLVRPVVTSTPLTGVRPVNLVPTAALRRRGAGPVWLHICTRKATEAETRGISTCRLGRYVYRP